MTKEESARKKAEQLKIDVLAATYNEKQRDFNSHYSNTGRNLWAAVACRVIWDIRELKNSSRETKKQLPGGLELIKKEISNPWFKTVCENAEIRYDEFVKVCLKEMGET